MPPLVAPRAMPSLQTDPDPVLLAAVDAQCFAPPWGVTAFEGLCAHPAIHGWVLRDDAGAAAGLVCFHWAGDEGELYRIGVVPAARGQGLGLWLLRRLLAASREAGVRRLHLEVRESNGAARRLYARAGFSEAGRRRGYYRDPAEDAVVCVWEAEDGRGA